MRLWHKVQMITMGIGKAFSVGAEHIVLGPLQERAACHTDDKGAHASKLLSSLEWCMSPSGCLPTAKGAATRPRTNISTRTNISAITKVSASTSTSTSTDHTRLASKPPCQQAALPASVFQVDRRTLMTLGTSSSGTPISLSRSMAADALAASGGSSTFSWRQ